MTCIVGLVDRNDRVHIGADSASVDRGHVIVHGKSPKVFIGKRGILYGVSTSFRMLQLLEHEFDPGEIPEDGESLLHWMVTVYCRELRRCFYDAGFSSKTDNIESAGRFLCSLRGRLFMIDSDFHVNENKYPYNAIGSGYEFSLGSLRALYDLELKPIDIVFKTLEIAAYHCATVDSPFDIVSVSKDGKSVWRSHTQHPTSLLIRDTMPVWNCYMCNYELYDEPANDEAGEQDGESDIAMWIDVEPFNDGVFEPKPICWSCQSHIDASAYND